ncbi:hypothetical protein ACIPSE_37215 [Streptomyces sp. NPDC090106]|uniref:hypothetical protein n=1 Tax=Streptomyces sp. NPDC090106 TaxID=3365946 RepID=UPI00382875BF
MTQSGQGEEPSQRVAREGIVLPSDGGEPLLPGMAGGPVGPHIPAQPTPPAPAAPPGGQSWGNAWGPEQQAPAPQPGDGWGAQQGQSWSAPDPYGPQTQQWSAQDLSGGVPEQPQAGGQAPGGAYDADQPTSYYLPPAGQDTPAAPPQAAHPGYDADQATSYYLPPVAGTGVSAPLPPADPYGNPAGNGASTGVPLPPVDEGATQYIPPVQAQGPYGQPAPDEGATQFIPPVGPGALPPEVPAGGGQPQFPGQQPHAAGPDAQATQFIPPVTDDSRQPPSEFDNLFRDDAAGAAPSTQQLPRFDQAAPPPAYAAPQPSYGSPGRRAAAPDRDGGRPRSRVPVIAAVGIGIAVLGIGAGALMAGGGGDDKSDANQPVSATAPATEESASPSSDAVKEQAVALDKLLADSGNSRSSVISAVADVKACKDLGQAGTDLRNAATQRNDLVTRLGELSVDQLPDHEKLTSALTDAWKASASADTHYAAWADQVGAKKNKLCRKGQASSTGQTQQGNRASGEATTAKKTAAQLWNTIAKQYGLTERTYTQL